MNKVFIPVNRAYEATLWASVHFKNFRVQHMFPEGQYEFIFEQPEHASFFALRWTQ